jgi:hypothetical protein
MPEDISAVSRPPARRGVRTLARGGSQGKTDLSDEAKNTEPAAIV